MNPMPSALHEDEVLSRPFHRGEPEASAGSRTGAGSRIEVEVAKRSGAELKIKLLRPLSNPAPKEDRLSFSRLREHRHLEGNLLREQEIEASREVRTGDFDPCPPAEDPGQSLMAIRFGEGVSGDPEPLD